MLDFSAFIAQYGIVIALTGGALLFASLVQLMLLLWNGFRNLYKRRKI